jgi:hypothetical protein
MPTIVMWEVFGKSARICRDGKPDLILSIGDCFTFDYEIVKRSNDICVVTQFTGYKNDSGPIGFNYVPWKIKENRWDFVIWGKNSRHLICMPCGIGYFGDVINWETLQIVNGIDDPDFKLYIKNIKSNEVDGTS